MMVMTSALVQKVETKTEMDLDRETRNRLLFLPGLSPIGCADKWLMTGSMISGVSAFAQPVGARFVDPSCESRGMFCQNTRGHEVTS